MCTYLALEHSDQLILQSQLEGVTEEERTALLTEAWAVVSSSLPLIVERMDDNTMLPGRGTAVELAFYKRYRQLARAVFGWHPHTARELQLEGLSLGYANALKAASLVLDCMAHMLGVSAELVHKMQAFVLRVVDNMQPAARSLGDFIHTLPEEAGIAFRLDEALIGGHAELDSTFITSLRTKWTAAAMVQMRRARGLLDTSEVFERVRDLSNADQRADVAKYGLKECALPSCGKLEASVGEHVRCSACRSAWYCSAEHGTLHWKEHKPVCRATTASQQAAAGQGAARD